MTEPEHDDTLITAYRAIAAPSDAVGRARQSFENHARRRFAGVPLAPLGAVAALLAAAVLWPGDAPRLDVTAWSLVPPVREFAIPPRPSIAGSLPAQPSLSVVSPPSMRLISQTNDEV